eukprot:757628-Hanusia_phi.AAC.12
MSWGLRLELVLVTSINIGRCHFTSSLTSAHLLVKVSEEGDVQVGKNGRRGTEEGFTGCYVDGALIGFCRERSRSSRGRSVSVQRRLRRNTRSESSMYVTCGFKSSDRVVRRKRKRKKMKKMNKGANTGASQDASAGNQEGDDDDSGDEEEEEKVRPRINFLLFSSQTHAENKLHRPECSKRARSPRGLCQRIGGG